MSPLGFPPFRERFPWIGPHLQTVRNTLVHPRVGLPPGECLRFPMEDGTGDVLAGTLTRREMAAEGRALVVLVHGLTGCEDSFYVRATARALLDEGFPVLRLNLRGAGPSSATCRQRYHAGRTGDLRKVLGGLPQAELENGVALIGYSLGGNAVLKLLGEGEFPVPVRAGAGISAPIDLSGSSRCFLLKRNAFYHRRLLGSMKRETLALGPDLPDELAQAVREVRSVWEFDDRVVARWNGWSGAEEYYRINSALQFLPAIQVPTLVIHALDDPWIPGSAYTAFDWAGNPALTPLLPPRGGHVGFHGVDGIWHDRCLAQFLLRHAA